MKKVSVIQTWSQSGLSISFVANKSGFGKPVAVAKPQISISNNSNVLC